MHNLSFHSVVCGQQSLHFISGSFEMFGVFLMVVPRSSDYSLVFQLDPASGVCTTEFYGVRHHPTYQVLSVVGHSTEKSQT